MKKSAICLVLIMFIAALGCDKFSGSDVSTVKDGLLDFDKSLTVGKAFENYKYFKKSEWQATTTENGKKIVSVKSEVDITKHPQMAQGFKKFELQFQFVINQDKTFQVAWCGVSAEAASGQKIEPQQTVDLNRCTNSLRAIYNNSPDL